MPLRPPIDPNRIDIGTLAAAEQSRHSHSFDPLVLDRLQKAGRRRDLSQVLAQIAYIQGLGRTHSSMEYLTAKALRFYRVVISQALIKHYQLRQSEAPFLYATPAVASHSDLALPILGQVPNLALPRLPPEVLDPHRTYWGMQPWLNGGLWYFDSTYPRAKGLCHLHGVIVHPGGMYKVCLAHDKSAGRLYHLMHHLASLPYQLSFAGVENRYDKPPGHIAQYILSNHGAL